MGKQALRGGGNMINCRFLLISALLAYLGVTSGQAIPDDYVPYPYAFLNTQVKTQAKPVPGTQPLTALSPAGG